jgi:hypothetical protein
MEPGRRLVDTHQERVDPVDMPSHLDTISRRDLGGDVQAVVDQGEAIVA